METDRNLLFGVLALQADLITQDQFVQACTLWTTRKQTALADLLLEQGWLTGADRSAVERLLECKLRKHQGDARASLAEVATNQVQRLLAVLNDADVQRSLDQLSRQDGHILLSTVSSLPETRERYTLTRLHAEGGIGRVWLARDSSLGREVALKELQPERIDNPAFWSRFLKEAQITGQLEHPGIVPVYELSRRSENRQPFYTMRFVKGRTLSEAIQAYHRKRKAGQAGPLDLSGLLNAFVGVCQAVAYAHSRGVIHRDLKGQNVVLGDYGEVILLDWGLAKLVDRPEAEDTTASVLLNLEGQPEATVQGQVLGTPAYMAPEQAEGRLELIDQRTDVYGLGAILYEILTGQPPFTGINTEDVLRKVREEEPLRPRTLCAGMSAALEAVCLRALAKKPAARYARAAEVAQEVKCWLAGEPVTAYREHLATRLMRWGRRHRTFVTSGAVLFGTLLPASLVFSWILVAVRARANEEKGRAQAAEVTAKAINTFLTEDLLAVAQPEKQGREVTIRQALDAAVPKIALAFAGKPIVEGSVRRTIGITYYKLGLYPKGELQLRRVLDLARDIFGKEHEETLTAVNDLALVLLAQGKLSEAEPLCRGNVELCRRVQGPENPKTLGAVHTLAQILRAQGKLSEAEALFRQNLEVARRVLGLDHPDTLAAVHNLAWLLQAQGKLPEAEPLYRQNLETCRRVLGPDHPDTLASVHALAGLLQARGKLSEAESLLRQNLESCRRILGPEHPGTLTAMNSMARWLQAEGKLSEAEPLLGQNLEICRRVLGPEHPNTLVAMNSMAQLFQAQGKLTEAEPLLRQNLEICRRVHGTDHAETLGALHNLALLLMVQGKLTEAEPLLRQNLQAYRRVLGPDHPHTLAAVNGLAALLRAERKLSEAESLFRQNLETIRRNLGPEHPNTLGAANNLALLLRDEGKFFEAELLFQEVLRLRRKILPAGHTDLATTLAGLGSVLAKNGKVKEAEPLLRECLEIRQKSLPTGDWLIADTQSLLGGCLTEQARYADAEPLLLDSCLALDKAQGLPASIRGEARKRIVRLYESWGKPEKAALWRAKQDHPTKPAEKSGGPDRSPNPWR